MSHYYESFDSREEEHLLKSAILSLQSTATELRIDIKNHPELEECVRKLVHYSKNAAKNHNQTPAIDYHFSKWLVQTILSKRK